MNHTHIFGSSDFRTIKNAHLEAIRQFDIYIQPKMEQFRERERESHFSS